MLMAFWWRQIQDAGDRIIMLAFFWYVGGKFSVLNRSPTFQRCRQHIPYPTSVTNIVAVRRTRNLTSTSFDRNLRITLFMTTNECFFCWVLPNALFERVSTTIYLCIQIFGEWQSICSFQPTRFDFTELIIFSFATQYNCFSFKNHWTGEICFGTIPKIEINALYLMI